MFAVVQCSLDLIIFYFCFGSRWVLYFYFYAQVLQFPQYVRWFCKFRSSRTSFTHFPRVARVGMIFLSSFPQTTLVKVYLSIMRRSSARQFYDKRPLTPPSSQEKLPLLPFVVNGMAVVDSDLAPQPYPSTAYLPSCTESEVAL